MIGELSTRQDICWPIEHLSSILYPNELQKNFFVRAVGCFRYVFNHFLSLWEETYALTGTAVGIDLVITHIAVLSDGTSPLNNLKP